MVYDVLVVETLSSWDRTSGVSHGVDYFSPGQSVPIAKFFTSRALSSNLTC